MPTGTLRIFKGLWKLEKSFRRAGPVSEGHLENQKQNGSETVETECKIAGEKKKEKSGGECSRDGVMSGPAGANEGKRGFVAPGDFDQDSKPPAWSPKLRKDVCFGD